MSTDNANAAPLKPLPAFLTVLALLVVVILWLVVGGKLFGITSFFASFLFVWYWASVEHADFGQWLPSLGGALMGLALAWQARELPIQIGASVPYVALGVIALAIWFQLIGWFPLLFNRAAMLFLTLFAAPALLSILDPIESGLAIVLGAIYFAGVFKLIGAVAQRRAAKAAVDATS